MYFKHYFLVFLLCSIVEFAFGQILLLNSSFENGHPDCGNTNIKKWNTCEIGVYNCIIDTIPYAKPDSAIDGRFVGEVSAGNNYIGSFSQYTPCTFTNNISYNFSVYMASYIPDGNSPVFPNYSRGKIEIWIGNDTCQWQQMIFLSPLLDSVWQNFTVNFVPNADYNYFFFRGHPPTTSPVLSTLMIDALSPISVTNARQVEAITPDTTLPVGSSVCVNLQATATAAYNSVWWEQVGTGTISNQLNAGVHCVDTTTTFIVHIMGSDSTCAGYMPSSDTVRVKFYNPNGIGEISKAEIKIYPNPADDKFNFTYSVTKAGTVSFSIFDIAGKLVRHSDLGQKSAGAYNAAAQIVDLAAGTYIVQLTTGSEMVYKKLIKVN